MGEFIKAGSTDELSPGTCKVARAGVKTIALFNVGGKFYATDNTCLHRGGPLGEGSLSGSIVTCPLHGWQYQVTDGRGVMDPSVKISAYPVKVEGDDVLVQV